MTAPPFRPRSMAYPAPPYAPLARARGIRPMDPTEFNMERFNRTGRGTGIVYQAARVRGPLTLDRARRAMATLTERHPSLFTHVTIEPDTAELWLSTTDAPVPVVGVAVSDLDRWVETVEADIDLGPMDTVRGPMFALGVLGPDPEAEHPDAEVVLLLAGHHCVCDAVSLSAMVDELLSILAGEPERPRRELESLESHFRFEDAALATLRRERFEPLRDEVGAWSALPDRGSGKGAMHADLLARLEALEEEVLGHADLSAAALPSLLLDLHQTLLPVLRWREETTWVHPEADPGTGQRRAETVRTILRHTLIDEATARAAASGAKARGITMHGALGGAALFATALRHFRLTREPLRDLCIPIGSPVSLRSQVSPQLEIADLRMAVDVVLTPTDVPRDAPFWSVATAFGTTVTRAVARRRALSSWFLTEPGDRTAYPAGVPMVLLSNVGKSPLRQTYGPLEVLDACCLTSTHGVFQIDMLVTSFRGRLSTCFYFEEPTLSRASLDRFSEDFERVLRRIAEGDDPTLEDLVTPSRPGV